MFLPMLILFIIIAFIGESIYQSHKKNDNENNQSNNVKYDGQNYIIHYNKNSNININNNSNQKYNTNSLTSISNLDYDEDDSVDEFLINNNLNYYNNNYMSDSDSNFDSYNYHRDPFKIGQYKNEVDFYDDNLEEFSSFEEAEEYFNKNRKR